MLRTCHYKEYNTRLHKTMKRRGEGVNGVEIEAAAEVVSGALGWIEKHARGGLY